MQKRAAIYVRVSTDKQTVENQVTVLRQIAERRGWEIIGQYSDAGISGAKGRDGRPGLDQMLKDASRRKFDVVMAWAIDRLGRSLIDLLGTIQTLEACGVDLYLDQQSIDTTTPAGKLMFQVCGAFGEFERSMIRQRIHAGLKRAVAGSASTLASNARSHRASNSAGLGSIRRLKSASRHTCVAARAYARSRASVASALVLCSAFSRR
jgi:DNA invertase Pin-like site-specific DNA recombinase